MSVIRGRWRTNSVDEFGTVGLTVKTLCAYCDESYHGHRDEGRVWFEKHMRRRHRKILKVQAQTPSKLRKRSKGAFS